MTDDIGPLAQFPACLIYKAKADWFWVLGSWAEESRTARRKYDIQKEKNRGSWR